MARKRREMISNLNLVPFIDLFSTLILFLISTAVFDQLAVLPINMGNPDAPDISVPSPSEARKIEANVKVTLTDKTIELFDSGERRVIDREQVVASAYDDIRAFAENARAKHPEKRDVVISASDVAVYEDLIAIMDRLLEQNFDQLVVMGSDL
jgi:biopolymer transport protein ExbD